MCGVSLLILQLEDTVTRFLNIVRNGRITWHIIGPSTVGEEAQVCFFSDGLKIC